jgi:subtilisin family serine protease
LGRFVATSLVTVALVSGVATSAARSGPVAATSPSSYIVVLNDGADAAAATASLERSVGFKSRFRYRSALKGFAAQLTEQQVATLRASPQVQFVSPDGVAEAVGYVPIVPGDNAPTGVRRIGAAVDQTSVKPTAVGARVAVLDTGIDLANSDLDARNGTNCISPGRKAQDDNGHGTHIAGTISARNNGSNVVGVSPGTRVYAVKVLDSTGAGSFAQIVCGIDWVAAHGPGTKKNIRVANLSLGGGGADDANCGNSNGDALHKAICKAAAKGITFVAAAGKSSVDFAGVVPAAYDEVLTVTAMADSDGAPGGFGGAPACSPSETDDSYLSSSNFAVSAADRNHTIAGPGVCITSDRLGGGTTVLSGTSVATPHSTGSASLCIGSKSSPGPCAGLTSAQVIQKLRNDAAAHATPGPIPGSSNGFIGDPNHPIAGKYFGFLIEASGYQ